MPRPSSRPTRAAHGAAALVAATALAACATARASMDPALAAEERLTVSGVNGSRIGQVVRFGEFSAGPVDRSATHGGDRGSTGFDGVRRESTRRAQRYGFTLRASGATPADSVPWRGECELSLRGREARVASVVVRARSFRQAITCELAARGGERWSLVLEETDSTAMGGQLTRTDATQRAYTVRPITRFEGARIENPAAVGWEFVVDDRVLGAVDRSGGGGVVLPRRYGDEARRVMAAAAAALLLFDDLDPEGMAPGR